MPVLRIAATTGFPPLMNRRAALFSSRKIGLVVNQADFLISHRLELASALRELGARVLIFCPSGTGEEKLEALGFEVVRYPLSRSGRSPFAELRSCFVLSRLYRELQPDLVHHVTVKPVLYGTRAARRQHVPAVINAVTGLGYLYTATGLSATIRRGVANLLYRVFMRHDSMRVIFQNSEDRDAFLKRGLVPAVDAVIIRGSGVDLNRFSATPSPAGAVSFLLVGRMLADKGVREFVTAARQLHRRYPGWKFRLLGGVDTGNPSALRREELEGFASEGIEWLGHRMDVDLQLREHHVIVLPSYREGMPKALLEAAASGRPVITTDIPGCRDIVRDGVTGLLVPPRDAAALTEAMEQLGNDDQLRRRMGEAGRIRASAFSVEDVVEHTLRVYAALLQERQADVVEQVVA